MDKNLKRKIIPFIKPSPPLLEEIYKDLLQVYKNGIFTNMGPFEKKFENKMEKYLGSSSTKKIHVVAVSSATLGLLLAIKAFEPRRPTVIVPSFTFAATVEAIIWAGYRPIFVDIDEESWSMVLIQKIRNLIRNRKIGMVLFVNPFGIPGNIDEWEELANKYNIPLLVDSAAGIGSFYPDRTNLGLKGSAEVFSLHITKTFGVGEGGLITTTNTKLANKLRMMKNFGFDKNHIVKVFGTNAKLPEFASVMGLHVIKNYPKALTKKRKLARLYLKYLNPEIKTHKYVLNSANQFYPALFPTISMRASKEEKLKKLGVETRRYYYPPMHKHPIFNNIPSIDTLEVTENLSQRILALPLHLHLSGKDIADIAKVINS